MTQPVAPRTHRNAEHNPSRAFGVGVPSGLQNLARPSHGFSTGTPELTSVIGEGFWVSKPASMTFEQSDIHAIPEPARLAFRWCGSLVLNRFVSRLVIWRSPIRSVLCAMFHLKRCCQ